MHAAALPLRVLPRFQVILGQPESECSAPALLAPLQLGKGDVREARAVSNRLLGLGIGAGAALAAAFWLAEPVIPSIFSSDAGARGRGGCQARGPRTGAWR